MSVPSLIPAEEYAALRNVAQKTVRRWCLNASKAHKDQNSSLPKIRAKRIGRKWWIDLEGTEQAQSVAHGTTLEKELTRKSLR